MASFYNIDLQIDANFDTNSIPPFSTIATNFQIQTDEGISLLWTNNELGNSNELEAIIEADSTGHSYLVGSVVTSGATGTYSCDVPNTNGLTFMRYWALRIPMISDIQSEIIGQRSDNCRTLVRDCRTVVGA